MYWSPDLNRLMYLIFWLLSYLCVLSLFITKSFFPFCFSSLSGKPTGSDRLGASGLEALCQCKRAHSLQSIVEPRSHADRVFGEGLSYPVELRRSLHSELQEHNPGELFVLLPLAIKTTSFSCPQMLKIAFFVSGSHAHPRPEFQKDGETCSSP